MTTAYSIRSGRRAAPMRTIRLVGLALLLVGLLWSGLGAPAAEAAVVKTTRESACSLGGLTCVSLKTTYDYQGCSFFVICAWTITNSITGNARLLPGELAAYSSFYKDGTTTSGLWKYCSWPAGLSTTCTITETYQFTQGSFAGCSSIDVFSDGRTQILGGFVRAESNKSDELMICPNGTISKV